MKRKHQELLTSEQLRKRFVSQFDLVSYAIDLAEVELKREQELSEGYEYVNCANKVLEDIVEGRDQVEQEEPIEESLQSDEEEIVA